MGATARQIKEKVGESCAWTIAARVP